MVVRWLLLLLVPVSILMVPVPSGLTPLAWKIFAVYIAAIWLLYKQQIFSRPAVSVHWEQVPLK